MTTKQVSQALSRLAHAFKPVNLLKSTLPAWARRGFAPKAGRFEHDVPGGRFVVKMSKTYKEKLQSVFWQKKRLSVLEESRWRCRECGEASRQLQVHHVFYLPGRDPWDYPDHLLLVLCDSCHVKRQEVEVKLFSNVAEILFHKTIEDIKRQPIWTMFCDERPATEGGAL